MGSKTRNKKNSPKKMNFIVTKDTEELKIFDMTPTYDALSSIITGHFGLKGAWTVSYVDVEGDHIAIEDDDDLEVCIFEFSEMSKIDEPVQLVIEEFGKVTKKKSKSFTDLNSNDVENNKLPKMKKEVVAKVADDNVSQISEKVASMLDSKIFDSIDSKMASLTDPLAMPIEKSISARFEALE